MKRDIKNILKILEVENGNEKFYSKTSGKLMKAFSFIEGVSKLALCFCFLAVFSIVALGMIGVNILRFFDHFLLLICLFSALLFISKNFKSRETCRVYSHTEGGFYPKKEIKFNDCLCIDDGAFDYLCKRDEKALRMSLIQCRHQVESHSRGSELFIDSTFLPFAFSFVIFIWKYFFNTALGKKIESLPEALSDIPWALPFAEKNWLKIYEEYELKVVMLAAIACLIYYFYKRLDLSEVAKKLHYDRAISILEYAICMASREETKITTSLERKRKRKKSKKPPIAKKRLRGICK